MCGEKPFVTGRSTVLMGSPPRMRGKGPLPRDALPALGITPAYAGKSLWSGSVRVWVWDHPRVCGEKCFAVLMVCIALGSPPRVRGKGILGAVNKAYIGITPAYAGKNSAHNMASVIRKDHPRVCGEKKRSRQGAPCVAGSPPRMRGKFIAVDRYQVALGITPAYAGKS